MQGKQGGGGGIRTHETLSRLTVFKTAPFGRSGTPPFPLSKRIRGSCGIRASRSGAEDVERVVGRVVVEEMLAHLRRDSDGIAKRNDPLCRGSLRTARATDPNEPGRRVLRAPTLVDGRAGSPAVHPPVRAARGQAAGGGVCSRGCSSCPPRSAFHRCANGVLAGTSCAPGCSCRVSLRTAQTPSASSAPKTTTNCHR